MVEVKLMKEKWYPSPHMLRHSWTQSMEIASQGATMIPILMYDEGLGTPSSLPTNPEHASFAEQNMPNCYPESRVDSIYSQLSVNLTKDAVETDKVVALRYGYMPIFTSFEDYTAIDEKSQNEIQDVLELQTETTDRQAYPLYNGTKVAEKFSGSATLHANVPGLTTNQILEGTDFNYDTYYDCLQYMTNGPKLIACQGGIKWNTLTKNKPIHNIPIKLPAKSKKLVQYGFFGLAVFLPQVGQYEQYHAAGDTTAVPHINCTFSARFNEWNQDFNFQRQ